MSHREISLVVGTAGHIDHGKTQLVKALTGVDCDRLNEEKKRGITIELGFAPLVLPSERVISLIDVPGHERFIRQMVSGASGIDAVMLIVAADEGVMPQTREHLDILSLLGVQHGIVVMTKKDLVDEEMLTLAEDDVRNLVSGTFLENAPIVAVSSVRGDGIEDLKAAIERLVDEVKPRDRQGAYFMPIDRTFPVAGFGTVVTGTAYKGSVSTAEEVEVFPSGLKSRVRSLQVHGKSVDTACAGQRVAMCLNDLSLDDLSRGDVVCAAGVYRSTTCIDVMLKLLRFVTEPLEHWQRVRLHIGTSDVLARVALLNEKTLQPGESSPVQLVLEEPIVASLGQRFVIRFYSPLRTIGGGEVLDPYALRPTGKKRRDIEHSRLMMLSGAEKREERIAAILDVQESLPMRELMVRVQERRQDLQPLLDKLEQAGRLVQIKVGDGILLSAASFAAMVEKLRAALKQFHETYPHQKGTAPEDLVNSQFPEQDRKLGRLLLDKVIEQKRIKLEEGLVSLPKFAPVDNSVFNENKRRLLDLCRHAAYHFILLEELPEKLSLSQKELNSLLDQLKKNNEVAILDGTFILSAEILDQLLDQLRKIEGGFTLAQVRDLTDSSRKFVLPVMEYLDGKGYTRRVGEKRILLKKA